MTDDFTLPGDAALFAALRAMWEHYDPVPADLADKMVATIAIDDLAREWELLSLLEDAALGAVRGGDPTTLQFGDGATSVLLHVSDTEDGRRRIDGWVDGTVLAVRLVAGAKERSASPTPTGRFAFDAVPAGTVRIRLVIKDGEGLRDFVTPEFEV